MLISACVTKLAYRPGRCDRGDIGRCGHDWKPFTWLPRKQTVNEFSPVYVFIYKAVWRIKQGNFQYMNSGFHEGSQRISLLIKPCELCLPVPSRSSDKFMSVQRNNLWLGLALDPNVGLICNSHTHKKRKYGEHEEPVRKNYTTGGYMSTEHSKIEIKI